MIARLACSLAILLHLPAALADDGVGLRRKADPANITISGVSAGAAMALQYAVAHSSSVAGVGSIAGPPWGCAEGRLSQALNACMCSAQPVAPKADAARQMAQRGEIDPLAAGKPVALKRSYVFQSAGDKTVWPQQGVASIAFLTDFIGTPPVKDFGDAADGSNNAQHGIITPDGADKCAIENSNDTYIRRCGAEDNAGKLLRALLAPDTGYDASLRRRDIPASDVWEFDQQPLIDAVKGSTGAISADSFGLHDVSPRRANLDMAAKGYLYVPPVCREAGSRCGVHVALHGCRQDARDFAVKAGYNNWAQHYRIVIVYPAIAPDPNRLAGSVCSMKGFALAAQYAWYEPNPNGCWDWWGYLDIGWPEGPRYIGKAAPQMRVIERIIAEVTAPGP